MACFLLGAVETVAIGRMFARKHGDRLDANQEFLALAGGNLAAGLGGGLPVSGGMSQSLVNDGAGARTPLSGLLRGVLIGVAISVLLLLRRASCRSSRSRRWSRRGGGRAAAGNIG
jgi:MFS superfamily sulfate permease-like transporter